MCLLTVFHAPVARLAMTARSIGLVVILMSPSIVFLNPILRPVPNRRRIDEYTVWNTSTWVVASTGPRMAAMLGLLAVLNSR